MMTRSPAVPIGEGTHIRPRLPEGEDDAPRRPGSVQFFEVR